MAAHIKLNLDDAGPHIDDAAGRMLIFEPAASCPLTAVAYQLEQSGAPDNEKPALRGARVVFPRSD